jgi:hypothetical protein
MEYLAELINQAQVILENGFDVQAFLTWKSFAFFFVVVFVGRSHYYAKNFSSLTSEASPKALLAGAGILVAIKEGLLQKDKRGKTVPQTHPRQ